MIQPFISVRQPVANRPVAASKAAPRTRPTFAVKLLSGAELFAERSDWETLVAEALEPNCFYEPWMLLPAVERLGGRASLAFALVYRHAPPARPKLCGLFPFERRKRLHGLPARTLSLWRHLHCVLCAPVLQHEYAKEALETLLRWAATDQAGADLLEFAFIPDEGPFAQILLDVVNELGSITFCVEKFNRALLRPDADANAYIHAALTPKHRREMERLRRRLADKGRLEARALQLGEDPEPWIADFLRLEAAGWKGTESTALSCSAAEQAFFTAVVHGAHARGQLMMVGLFLDDRPIALKCNFRSGAGAFALKIAFDETLELYSPGVQLELENIALAHRTPGLAWMDSCAVANHPMIDRLWTERRTIQHLLISTGGWYGNLLLGALPLARAVKRTMRKKAGVLQ